MPARLERGRQLRDIIEAEIKRLEALFEDCPDMPLLRSLYERFLDDPSAKRSRDIAIVEMEIVFNYRAFNNDGRKVIEELRQHLANLRQGCDISLQELIQALDRFIPPVRAKPVRARVK
jgi:hypothetical protein